MVAVPRPRTVTWSFVRPIGRFSHMRAFLPLSWASVAGKIAGLRAGAQPAAGLGRSQHNDLKPMPLNRRARRQLPDASGREAGRGAAGTGGKRGSVRL